MPVVPFFISTSSATGGLGGTGEVTDQPYISAQVEGWGDPYGESGGYGKGYYDGYATATASKYIDVAAFYVAAIHEEGIPVSVISQLPRTDGLRLKTANWVREDGGQLVTLRTGGKFPWGNYGVDVVVPGTSTRVTAYSGVIGQGSVIHPVKDPARANAFVSTSKDGDSISFVCPALPSLGDVDLYIRLASGTEILMSAALKCIAYTDRYSYGQMKRLASPILDIETIPATVVSS